MLRIKSQFEQYTTLVSFNKVRMEQDEINKQTKVMEKLMVIRSDMQREQTKMKEFVREENKVFSLKSSCTKDKKEVNELIDKLRHDVEALKAELRTSKERIRKLEVTIETKAYQIDVDEIKQ